MSRTLRFILWAIGFFIIVLIFRPLWTYIIDDYYHLEGIYGTLARALAAGIVCGIYALIASKSLR
jgi:hypothetical protein